MTNIITPTGHDVYVCSFCATVSTNSICDNCDDYNLLLSEELDNNDRGWLMPLVSARYLSAVQAFNLSVTMFNADLGYESDVTYLAELGVIDADLADYMIDGMDVFQAEAAIQAAA